MAQMMRSASLDGYVTLARSFGLNALKLIDAAGIPRNCLTNPDLKLSIKAYCQLLETSAKAARCEDFGVRLAESRQLSTFGPVGLVVREQETVRKAIHALVKNIRLHNESASLELEESGDIVIVKPDLAVARGVQAAQSKDMVTGVVCRVLTLLLGPTWRPESVLFVRAKPTSLFAFHRVFGSKLEFNQDYNGIVCLKRDIDRTIANGDRGLAREVERYVTLLDADSEHSVAKDIRKFILTLLPTGQCTAERVAQHVGVNRRTLHRHLAAMETSFSGLLEEIKDDLARTYIEHSERELTDVAALLGFSSQSAFSHWHRTTFGTSASERRRRASSSTPQPR